MSLTGLSLPGEVSVGMLAILPLGDDFIGRRGVAMQSIAINVRKDPVAVLGDPDRTLCEACETRQRGYSADELTAAVTQSLEAAVWQ